jgi:hypothetical protein
VIDGKIEECQSPGMGLQNMQKDESAAYEECRHFSRVLEVEYTDSRNVATYPLFAMVTTIETNYLEMTGQKCKV